MRADRPSPRELARIAASLQHLHVEGVYYKGVEITDRVIRRWAKDKLAPTGHDIPPPEVVLSELTLLSDARIGPIEMFKSGEWPERWEVSKEPYAKYSPQVPADFAARWNKTVRMQQRDKREQ
jgi:hypothetical protein